MPKYYDLHAHILPGVDDGPSDMSDSVTMAQVAAENGTSLLLATPHKRDVNLNHSIGHVKQLLEEFRREIRSKNIPIDVVLGMENHLDTGLPQDVEDGRALTVNSTRYVLVELPSTTYPQYVNDVLLELQAQGLAPIIVHPERNPEIQKRPALLKALVGEGMLAQVTAGSLTGDFGSRAKGSAEVLLDKGLVHVIASDTHHHLGHRTPVLTEGIAAAARIVGSRRALDMVGRIPKAILDDQAVEAQPR